MGSWTKLPAIPGKVVGCLCCGGNKGVYPLDDIFAVGFGDAGITRDGEPVWTEMDDGREADFEDLPTLRRFEALAAADPDHDWRLYRHGPLKGGEWQRHGDGAWVLIAEDEGFA